MRVLAERGREHDARAVAHSRSAAHHDRHGEAAGGAVLALGAAPTPRTGGRDESESAGTATSRCTFCVHSIDRDAALSGVCTESPPQMIVLMLRSYVFYWSRSRCTPLSQLHAVV